MTLNNMTLNNMTLNEYQIQAISTAIYKDTNLCKDLPYYGQIYCALQLAAEAGEVAGKYAKEIRRGNLQPEKEAVKDELGDVLWYIANLAHQLGFTLEEIAERNIEKLKDRKLRGVIHGEGDKR